MTQCFTKLFVGLVLALTSLALNAQTFNGQGGLLVPPGAPLQTIGITTSEATVSGIGILGTGCSYIENVTIDFTHTWVGDIALFIIAPSGEVLELSSSNGGSGDNFQITEFTDSAPIFITAGTPPYNGAFRPEGRQLNTSPPFPNTNPLGTYTFENTFTGVNADGDWTLMINDFVLIDVGVLNAWSITFATGGGPAPIVTLGPDVTICPGQSATLTANVDPAADSYEWSTGATTATINVSPAVNTTYSVTVTNNNCIDADTIQVIVNPNGVTANAGNDISICQGNPTTLTGSGGSTGATYNWSSGQSGSSISVNPSSTTTYTLTVTDNGCSDTDQVVVTVTPTPVAEAGPPVSICVGQTTTLTASGGIQNNQYQWSTGQTGASISVSPASSTTYTVTVTINGCADTDDVLVTVNPIPTINAGNDVQICSGESTTLTASGSGGTYQWSTGQSGASITVSPTTTTTYTVTATQNGCTATDNVTVTVGTITAGITPSQSICQGATVTLTATGGTTYTWSTGQTGSSITVSPSTTTTYTVTATQGLCSDDASTTVTVNPNPVAFAGTDDEVCAGQSITLTASGGNQNNQYLWNTGQTGATITVTPVTTSTYVVTLTISGCTDTDDVIVTVNPVPTVSAGADVIICTGESTTLTVSGSGGTYLWSTGQSGSTITVSPTTSTTYTVTATQNGCSATDNVTVTIADITAGITPSQSICEGETITLTATGGTNYDWSTGQTGPSITVTPSTNTTYSVTVSQGGCSDEATTTVTVNPIPVATVSDDEEICAGQSVTLVASGGTSYLWSSGQTTSTITVSPAVSTLYTVTVTSGGCSNSASVNVVVSPTPNAFAGDDISICEEESVTLTATGLQGPGSYQWNTGETTSAITVEPTTTTTYSVTITNTAGCTDNDAVTVTVNTTPIANAGPDQDLCEGSVATLTATGGTTASTYVWSTGQTGPSISVSPAIDTDYTVTVTVAGCASEDIVTVNVLPTPVADAGPDQSICVGESAILTASGGGNYMWSIGGNTQSVEVSPVMTSNYIVIVSNSNGCLDQDDVTVMVYPAVVANAGPDQSICAGETISLNGSGGASYQWSNGESSQMISVSPVATTSYQLTVTDVNGCSDVDVATVIVNSIPFANAGTNQFILPGQTATLTATGGGSYTWSTGETTSQITVMPAVTTVYTVTVTVNGCSDVDDVTVFVNEAPSIDLGPDVVICEGETATLDGTISGPFNITYLWSTGATTSIIDVTPATTTSYRVTATDISSGLSSSDTLIVTVLNLPLGTPVIQGSLSICDGETSTYTVNPIQAATSYTWSVSSGGNIISGQGSTSIEVDWSSTVAGQVEVIVSNSCGSLPAALLNVSIQSAPVLTGPISGTANPCAEGTSEHAIPGVASADTYQWSVSGGGIISSGQGTTGATIDWSGSTGGELCVIASNACGNSAPVCITINTTSTPSISAGEDAVTCGLITNFNGTGTGVWSFVSGPGSAVIATPTNNISSVVVTTGGQYVFNYSASLNGCESNDEVVIEFNDNPSIVNEIKDCNDTNTGYVVSFEISGGQAPYLINGIPFAGGIYNSNLINAGDAYSFIASDANGCESDELSGNVSCLCTTLAGTMSTNLIETCEDNLVTANYLGGEVLDGNDVLAFVLHDGNIPGGIISWNINPEFQFVPPMVQGETYFISAIVGDANANNLPQLSDACLAISEGTPVVFHGLPQANLSGDTTICVGSCVDVIIQATGNGSLVVDYALNNDVFTLSENSGIITIPVCPTVNTIFTLTSIEDQFCKATFSESIEITVRENAFAGNAVDYVVCAGQIETINLFDLLTNEDPGGSWTEISTSFSRPGAFNSASASFTIDNEVSGLYSFEYEIAGIDGCPGSISMVNVTINEIPSANAGDDMLIGCNPSSVILDGTGSSSGSQFQYSWSTIDGAISGESNALAITVTKKGSYILEVINTLINCSAFDTVIVSNNSQVPDFEVVTTAPQCAGDCNGVIEIQSNDSSLLFDLGDGTFTSNNIYTAACGGTYAIAVMDTLGCVVNSSITILNPPAVEITLGPDRIITKGDSVQLLAESAADIIQYNWFGASICETCPEIVVTPSTSTIYQVEVSDINGCTAFDEIEVTVESENEIRDDIFVPTVFSPNGDGVNDFFMPDAGTDIETIQSFEIFDRWGNKVFEIKNFLPGEQGWDGLYRGSPVSPGVYVYLIKAILPDGDVMVLNGDITVIK